MDNNASTLCVNGELNPGDLVLSTPADDYACLVGTVLSINKLGTPEHDAETANDTDDVHVNFMDSEYSQRRVAEIEEMFGELYGTLRPFEECPIDDVIMSPDALIRITGIGNDLLNAILDSREAAEALCGLVENSPATIRETHLSMPDVSIEPDEAALRDQLVGCLRQNLTDYFDALRVADGEKIPGMASEIAVTMEVYHYLTELHGFGASELEYLLQFRNPLEVVADEFLVSGFGDRSDVMRAIFDRQDALQGDYPLVTDEPPDADTPENGAVTRDDLLAQIAKRHCHFETLETRKRDSLDFHEVSVWGLKEALEEAFAVGARQMAQAKGTIRGDARQEGDPGEKLSVLDQIREAARAPREPRKNTPARDKSGPEL